LFPQDVKALIHTAAQVGYETRIVAGVEAVNADQKRVLFDKLSNHFLHNLAGRTFAMWGLAFKPNTDDLREAPSLTLIHLLNAAGAKVQAYDPEANAQARRLYADNELLEVCDTRNETLVGADALLVVTEWNEFRSPDFTALKSALKVPVIFDGRNLYEPDRLRDLGFAYYAIGRGT